MAKYSANIGLQSISIDAGSLASAFGAGSEFAIIIPNQGTPTITWQTVFAGGNPASITVLLEGSLDGIVWATVDTSSSITGEIKTVTGSFRFLRINNTAVTTGAGITLTASFVYSNRVSQSQADANLPALQYIKVVVPSAAILTSFSSPVTVIPAVPNAVIYPEIFFCHKPAGVAYTIIGVTNVGLKWGATSINAFSPIGFLDQAAAISQAMHAAGSSTAVYTGLTLTTLINVPVTFACAGANPAVGTSDITYWISYRVWPNAPLN